MIGPQIEIKKELGEQIDLDLKSTPTPQKKIILILIFERVADTLKRPTSIFKNTIKTSLFNHHTTYLGSR